MRRQVISYLKDDEDPQLVNDAIADSIESLWLSCIKIHLGQFLGGPVQNLNLAQGTERTTLYVIPDPPQMLNSLVTQIANGTGQPNLLARTFFFNVTDTTESGSETNIDYLGVDGNTGNGSPLSFNAAAGNLCQVVPFGAPNIPTGIPYGWNLYASVANGAPGTPDPANMVRQNSVPIMFNRAWTEPAGGILTVGDPDLFPPTLNGTADNIFYIRVLEVQNPDQTWTRWTAGNLDGLLMDRAVKQLAPATTYQRYAYDFVNGNTLELRPALGQTLSPRYFFVVKPRRLIYDLAVIPFQNLPYTEFVKLFSAAQCRRSVHEYTAASQDANAAETARISILEGLNLQATVKQKSITPYFRY